MQLISWEPFRGLERMFEEDLAVDVYEEGNTVVAEMALPGIDPDQLNVSVQEGYLRVSGSREELKEEKKKNYYRKEIKRGSFERLAHLPVEVQAEKAVATYKDGVLKVAFPKKNGAASGQVNIKVTKK